MDRTIQQRQLIAEMESFVRGQPADHRFSDGKLYPAERSARLNWAKRWASSVLFEEAGGDVDSLVDNFAEMSRAEFCELVLNANQSAAEVQEARKR